METISGKSAGRPGKGMQKGRAFGSSGAQAMQNGAQDAIKPAMVVPAPSVEVARKAAVSSAVLDVVSRLMRSSNGDRKSIISGIPKNMRVKVVNALALMYSEKREDDPNHEKGNSAMMIICCAMNIPFVLTWRERYWDTGEIRFTESERRFIHDKMDGIAKEVADIESNGGIK